MANGLKITNLVTTANTGTTLGIEITSAGWAANGIKNGGLITPPGPKSALLGELAIETATEDYFFLGSPITNGTLKLTGLDTNMTYALTFFGTRSNVSTRVSRYSATSGNGAIYSVTQTNSGTGAGAEGYNGNNHHTDRIPGLRPNSAGEIPVALDVDTQSGNTFAYLGILKIEQIAEAGGSGAAPAIAATPATLSFVTTNGAANPPSQSFGLTNVGSGTLNFTLSTNASWLTVSPSTGSLAAAAGLQITVSVNNAGLQAGSSNAVITIIEPSTPQATARTVLESLSPSISMKLISK